MICKGFGISEHSYYCWRRGYGGPKVDQAMLKVLEREIYRHRCPLAGVAAISGVVNLLALTGSLYMLQVYERVLTSRSLPTLVGLSVLMIGAQAAFGVLDLLRGHDARQDIH